MTTTRFVYEPTNSSTGVPRYEVFDRKASMTEPVAIVYDMDLAELIVKYGSELPVIRTQRPV